MSEIVLPAVGCLAGLEEDARRTLGAFGESVELKGGDTVIREGDRQDRLYFVVSGLLHAARQGAEQRLLLGRIEPGEWFGEINIFDPQAASATVTARESTVLWRISRAQLDRFLAAHPGIGVPVIRGIATGLSRRVRRMIDKLDVSQRAMSLHF